jgi:hypothetical protein
MTNDPISILLSQTAAFATIITAIVAFLIYKKSKSDELRSAVRIIILEIKESERVIKNLEEIKNSGMLYSTDLVKVTPLKGWVKYSHLFMKKLNNDQYDQLNDYFKKCEVLERYIEKNHNFFWITTEERAKQNEIMGAKLAYEKPELKDQEFKIEVEKLLATYFTNTSGYSPAGIKTQMDRILNSMTMITTTPVWDKLKIIAKYNDLLG